MEAAVKKLTMPVGLAQAMKRSSPSPKGEIVDATNEFLQYRQSLNQDRQQRLDEAHVQATRAILHKAQQRKNANLLMGYINDSIPS
jgi:hypothetical protein